MNIKIAKYNLDGEKAGHIEIKTRYENLKFNPDLVHQVTNSYMSNSRQVLSNTKSRAEVSGTGKKPYKQKGTGYARFGSLRTPIHVGGGIAFGPKKNRNFKKTLTKSMRQKALAVTLEAKNNDKEIFGIPDLKLDAIKTKNALASIAKLPIKDGNVLLVLASYDKNKYLSFRNIPYIATKEAKDLNSLDLLQHDTVLLEDKSQEILNKILG